MLETVGIISLVNVTASHVLKLPFFYFLNATNLTAEHALNTHTNRHTQTHTHTYDLFLMFTVSQNVICKKHDIL